MNDETKLPTDLIKMLKKDTELSGGFSKKAWLPLFIANFIAFTAASTFGLNVNMAEWIGLIALCISVGLVFYFCEQTKWRLLSGAAFLSFVIFWEQIIHAGSMAMHFSLGHGDIMCFSKGMLVSSLCLLGTSGYFLRNNIGPTRGSVLLISFFSTTAGTVAQAWCCRGGSFGHALKSHFGLMLVITVCTFTLYDLIRTKWLKSHLKKEI